MVAKIFLHVFQANPWLTLAVHCCLAEQVLTPIGQSPQHWFVHITFLHLCPSTSCVPSPFFKFFYPPGPSVLSLQLELLSLPHLLHSFHPSEPTAPLHCPCHSSVVHSSTATHIHCSESEHKSQPNIENLSTGWILHSKLWNLVAS